MSNKIISIENFLIQIELIGELESKLTTTTTKKKKQINGEHIAFTLH